MEEDDGCIEGVDEQEEDECVQEAAVVVVQGDVSIADETNTSRRLGGGVWAVAEFDFYRGRYGPPIVL